MPILYDFDCQEHGRFEKFAKMDDCEKPQPCPECGAESPRIYVAFSPRDYLETLVVYKEYAPNSLAYFIDNKGKQNQKTK